MVLFTYVGQVDSRNSLIACASEPPAAALRSRATPCRQSMPAGLLPPELPQPPAFPQASPGGTKARRLRPQGRRRAREDWATQIAPTAAPQLLPLLSSRPQPPAIHFQSCCRSHCHSLCRPACRSGSCCCCRCFPFCSSSSSPSPASSSSSPSCRTAQPPRSLRPLRCRCSRCCLPSAHAPWQQEEGAGFGVREQR